MKNDLLNHLQASIADPIYEGGEWDGNFEDTKIGVLNAAICCPKRDEIAHLTRVYENFTAGDDISFEISQGEIVALLGHNGAGKTTTMKMQAGFLEPLIYNAH